MAITNRIALFEKLSNNYKTAKASNNAFQKLRIAVKNKNNKTIINQLRAKVKEAAEAAKNVNAAQKILQTKAQAQAEAKPAAAPAAAPPATVTLGTAVKEGTAKLAAPPAAAQPPAAAPVVVTPPKGPVKPVGTVTDILETGLKIRKLMYNLDLLKIDKNYSKRNPYKFFKKRSARNKAKQNTKTMISNYLKNGTQTLTNKHRDIIHESQIFSKTPSQSPQKLATFLVNDSKKRSEPPKIKKPSFFSGFSRFSSKFKSKVKGGGFKLTKKLPT